MDREKLFEILMLLGALEYKIESLVNETKCEKSHTQVDIKNANN